MRRRRPGATPGGPGLIDFDPLSQCLIVLQSQPVQAEVQALLPEREPLPVGRR